jgi:hypothetical protein
MIKDYQKKPLYVCSTCGQDFTRRYNASRHNENIHSNKAEIVRFIEYLIGRMSGKYLPGDPLLYRIKNRNKNKPSIVHQNEANNGLYHEKSDSSSMKSLPYSAETRENRIDNKNTNLSNYIGNVKARNNPLEVIYYLYDLFQRSNEKNKERLQKQKIESNLEDIGRMLYDFYPPERAQILAADFNNRYNSTMDYIAFNRELENYRRTLVNRYLGYANPFK